MAGNVIGNILSTAAAGPLAPLTTVLNIGSTLIDRLVPDKNAAASLKGEMLQLGLQGELNSAIAQVQVNAVEAASPSWFVAGWRPAVGWVCVTGLGYQFLLCPLFTFFAGIAGSKVVAPSLDIASLMALLTGILGLGIARTVEKINGVSDVHQGS